MANKLALGLVIGGAVSSTVGSAFKEVEGRIKKLEAAGAKARVMQRQIGDTIRLRNEWKKAHDTGAAGSSTLLNKLNANLDSLRKQGIEVGRLDKAYQALGRTAQQADLKAKGHMQINQGRATVKSSIGKAAVGVAALAVPTKVSADYNAIIRDIAIKAGVANAPQEQQMSRTIISTSRDTGLARNEVANVVNELVGAGMDLAKALEYAPVAAKFVVGQGSGSAETAKMINALGQNAKITDAKEMQQALEAIAFQGQAGSFEASDMARWFPELLANMGKLGITGMDAVTQLGAMLQVQMKTAGGADEAANNIKNWMDKIGSSQTVDAYSKAGIDYEGSMRTGLQEGMSTLESSMALAKKYIEQTDPKRAAQMAEATAQISKEANPEKAKAMMASLEQALRTGDIFSDMQVKAALTAYMQNKELYGQLKRESRDASGILDKNLSERRESSSQKWAEMAQSMDDAMRSVGDAIRPITDGVAEGLTSVAKGITALSDRTPGLAMGLTVLAGGALTLQGLWGSLKIGKGLFNLARGALGGRDAKGVQKVFVTNAGDGDEKDEGKGSKVLALAEIGLKAFAGKRDGDDSAAEGDEADSESKGFNPIETGLKVLEVFREAKNDEDGGDDSGPQKVFVVNAAAMGGGGAGGQGRRRRGSNRNTRRRGGGPPRPPRPPVPPVPPIPASRTARAMGLIGKASKVIPGAALFEGVMKGVDTFQNAETQNEKAEGYGAAAGNMAGALAGAAAGAAIGSVVPILGTAVGGLIGGLLGSMGGESLGISLGKSWFGSDDEKPAEPEKPQAKPAGDMPAPVVVSPVPYDRRGPNVQNPFVLPDVNTTPRFPGTDRVRPSPMQQDRAPSQDAPRLMPGAVNMGDVVRSFANATPPVPLVMPPKVEPVLKVEPPKINQKIDVNAALSVTVQGDVKDPAALARELQPHLQRQIEQINQQMSNRNLYDEPHL
ncbi:phage tail tape measure protein [Pseudomonas helleri]|uniref:phage tail tape measure protein n=3 Tax=Pseudomonas TaxID=286 RepID=UPI0037C51C25